MADGYITIPADNYGDQLAKQAINASKQREIAAQDNKTRATGRYLQINSKGKVGIEKRRTLSAKEYKAVENKYNGIKRARIDTIKKLVKAQSKFAKRAIKFRTPISFGASRAVINKVLPTATPPGQTLVKQNGIYNRYNQTANGLEPRNILQAHNFRSKFVPPNNNISWLGRSEVS